MKSEKTYTFVYFVALFSLSLVVSGWWLSKGFYQVWEWEMTRFRGLNVSLEWALDFHSAMYFSTVCLVSAMVLMYSMSYIPSAAKNLFLMILMGFILSMLVLVFSKSLFWAVLGWDGLGVSSFLLILHFKNWSGAKSAMVTFMTNRLGDVFILTAIGVSVVSLGSDLWGLLSVCVLIGAITKSAQFPFSAWLPLAMAAPTPVSSLVHSSTLVTAGVFLLTRFNSMVSGLEEVLFSLATLTLCYSGMMALFEWDLKKIIAFSTLSHLSLMVLMISASSLYSSTFHMGNSCSI